MGFGFSTQLLGKAFKGNVVSVEVSKHCMIDVRNVVFNTASIQLEI